MPSLSPCMGLISPPTKQLATLRSAVEREFTIIDATVWATAVHDTAILRRECGLLIEELLRAG